jgi:hypothetical protein
LAYLYFNGQLFGWTPKSVQTHFVLKEKCQLQISHCGDRFLCICMGFWPPQLTVFIEVNFVPTTGGSTSQEVPL